MSGNKYKVSSKKGWKKAKVKDVENYLYEKSVMERIKNSKLKNDGIYDYTMENNTKENKNDKYNSFVQKSLNDIAPLSYKIKEKYLSSDEENDVEKKKLIKISPNIFKDVYKMKMPLEVTEDLWGDIKNKNTKRIQKTKNTLPEFHLQFPATALSYNPEFEKYEKYVNDAAKFELSKKTKIEKNRIKNSQMRESLIDDLDYFEVALAGDYKIENKEINEEKEFIVPLIPNRLKAKSRKEKLRKKINKKNLKVQTHLRGLEKGIRRDIQQLRFIQSEITKEKKQLIKKQLKDKKRRKNIEKQKILQKTLSSISEIPLPEELTGSLRTIKPTLNILENKGEFLRASKLIVDKRKKKSRNRLKVRPIMRMPNKIMQDLDDY